MTYRWKNPHHWLMDKMREANGGQLLNITVALLRMVDADQIQDRFEREMDEDGYFDEVEEEL